MCIAWYILLELVWQGGNRFGSVCPFIGVCLVCVLKVNYPYIWSKTWSLPLRGICLCAFVIRGPLQIIVQTRLICLISSFLKVHTMDLTMIVRPSAHSGGKSWQIRDWWFSGMFRYCNKECAKNTSKLPKCLFFI